MTEETISTLIEQRLTLLRDLSVFQLEARRCEIAIGHVEATILLLCPDFDWATVAETGQAAKEVLFQPGEVPLLALDALNESDTPLSTADIIDLILARKGMSNLTTRERRTLARRLHAVLSARVAERVVRKIGRTSSGGMGRPACTIWSLERKSNESIARR